VSELSLQDKRANDEVVVRMYVVSATLAAEGLVSKYTQPPKAGLA
jgi:hypothetical protein